MHQAAKLGIPFQMAETAHRVNEGMPLWVGDRVCKELEDRGVQVDGSSVLLLGVTYKPDIADARHTPAVPLAQALVERGATVTFHDPFVSSLSWPGGAVAHVPDLAEAIARADMTVLLQRHHQYDIELLASAKRLFDSTGTMLRVATAQL